MSFLTTALGFRTQTDASLNLNVPNIFGNFISAIQNLFSSVSSAINNVSKIHLESQVLEALFRVSDNWNFELNKDTKIECIKVEREEKAIIKTRNVLHDLFE